jgi:hypothetical protein
MKENILNTRTPYVVYHYEKITGCLNEKFKKFQISFFFKIAFSEASFCYEDKFIILKSEYFDTHRPPSNKFDHITVYI